MMRFKIQFKGSDPKLGWFDIKNFDGTMWHTHLFDRRGDAADYAKHWWPDEYASGDARVMPDTHQEDYDAYN